MVRNDNASESGFDLPRTIALSGEPSSDFGDFARYVDTLVALAFTAVQALPPRIDPAVLTAALDGQSSSRLRELVPEVVRKGHGAFFTSSALAQRAIRPYAHEVASAKVILDPACGAGDLLLACARHLHRKSDLTSTIETWGKRLQGMDVRPEFVRATKARLVLLASSFGMPFGADALPSTDQAFPSVKQGDALNAWDYGYSVPEGSMVVLNPPFPKISAPLCCQWGSGKVSLAAIFLEKCLKLSPAGTKVVAILPEVLRPRSAFA